MAVPTEMMVVCEQCDGDGVDYSNVESQSCDECLETGELGDVLCDVCDGDGCEACYFSGMFYNVTCPRCRGTGQFEFSPKCALCNGTGWHPNMRFKE